MEGRNENMQMNQIQGWQQVHPKPLAENENMFMHNEQYMAMVKNAQQVEQESEKKHYNLGTILLLTTGSIFVAVAATIFVVKAWAYMDHVGKVLLMLLATGLCFGLSNLAEKKLQIKGSSSAMYYLATVLSGITMLAFVNEDMVKVMENTYGLNFSTAQSIQMLLTYTAMFVPMLLRLVKRKFAVDCIFAVSLFDLIVFVICDMLSADYEMICVIMCLTHSAILILYEKLKSTQEKSLLLGLKIMVIIHAVFYFILVNFAAAILLFWEDGWTLAILALVEVTSFAVMFWYYSRNKSILAMIATFGNLACLVLGFAGIEMPDFMDTVIVEEKMLIVAIGIWALKPICMMMSEKTEEFIYYVRFAFNCLLMTVLLWYNIEEGQLINVLILGIIGAAMLVWAVMNNQKAYTILAAIVLILLVLYMTKELWMAISWWVYLMIVGIGMIVIAIVREKRDQQ